MLPIVIQAIEEFYVKKNNSLFKELCKKPLDLSEELKNYIKFKDLRLEGKGDFVNSYGEWHIEFNPYKKGTFEASYTTSLLISKTAPVFSIDHGYSIVNKDKKLVEPDLSDWRDRPYTKSQLQLHETIAADLTSKGYMELCEIDLSEVVTNPDLNVTVIDLLFWDIYNIVGDDE